MERMGIKQRFLIGILVLVAVLGFGFGRAAHAIPSLGVGTGTFGGCSAGDPYWECFSGNSASGSGHGFAIDSDPETVHLWSNIQDADIWLLAEPSFGTFTFGGESSSLVLIDSAFSSYVTPYQGVNLGPVDTSDGWVLIEVGEFDEGANAGTFYRLTGTFDFDAPGDWEGDWLFLAADDNGEEGLQGHPDNGNGGPNGGGPFDSFSPKTTGAVGVPEPGTVLLLGTGLLGLGLWRKFRP